MSKCINGLNLGIFGRFPANTYYTCFMVTFLFFAGICSFSPLRSMCTNTCCLKQSIHSVATERKIAKDREGFYLSNNLVA